jgi:hypothetical protein
MNSVRRPCKAFAFSLMQRASLCAIWKASAISREAMMTESTNSATGRRENFPPEHMPSRAEVAKTYNIPVRYLEIAACKGGGPPFVKIGRLVRYRVRDLEDWIASNRYENTAQFKAKVGGKT